MFQGVTKIQLQKINIKKCPQFSPMVLKKTHDKEEYLMYFLSHSHDLSPSFGPPISTI